MDCNDCIHDCEKDRECDMCGESIGECCSYPSPTEEFDVLCFNCSHIVDDMVDEDPFLDDEDNE